MLIASPLLLAAASPVDTDTDQFPCNVPVAEGSVPASYGEDQDSYAWETRNEAVAEEATEFSGMGGPSLGKRWAIARRLLHFNRYAQDNPLSEDNTTAGITNTPATAPTQNNCLAQQNPLNETLLAQAEEPDLLPVLGAPPARPVPEPVSPPARPVPAPASPPVRPRPAPRPVPPANNTTPSGFPQERPTSVDPTNVTPTTVNPTPFDGSTIQTLASRPDGNYRYIAGNAESRSYTDAEIRQRGSAVFVLKKEGNRVTGNLLPSIGLPGICVTGIVSGDTISGSAYLHSSDSPDSPNSFDSATDSQPASNSTARENVALYGNGVLQVGRSQMVKQGEKESTYYTGTVLDLSSFSMINAGSSLPPESCLTTPAHENVSG